MRTFISSWYGSLVVALIIGLSYIGAGFIYLFAVANSTLRLARGPIFMSGTAMPWRDRLAAGGAYGLFAITLPQWIIVSIFDVSIGSAFFFTIELTLMSWAIRGNLPSFHNVNVSGTGVFSYDADGTQWSWAETDTTSRFAFWPIGALKSQLNTFIMLAVTTCVVYLAIGGSWPASNAAALELAQTALIPTMGQLIWSLLPLLCVFRFCQWMLRQVVNSNRTNMMPITA